MAAETPAPQAGITTAADVTEPSKPAATGSTMSTPKSEPTTKAAPGAAKAARKEAKAARATNANERAKPTNKQVSEDDRRTLRAAAVNAGLPSDVGNKFADFLDQKGIKVSFSGTLEESRESSFVSMIPDAPSTLPGAEKIENPNVNETIENEV